MNEQGFYILDVCSTCGKQAKFPFCEHRPRGYPEQDAAWNWTEAIVVQPKTARGRELALRWVKSVNESIDAIEQEHEA